MGANFQYCPKCGTRNFADDKTCGICNAKLSGLGKEDMASKANKPSKLGLLWIIPLLAFVTYLLFFNGNEPSKSPSNKSIDNEDKYLPAPLSNSPLIDYKVEEILNNKMFCTITIRLANKINKARIKDISEKVKKDVGCMSNKVRLFFLLPEIKTGNGAWARVDYKPDFTVLFYGPSLENEQSMKEQKNNSKYNVIGQWIDNSGTGGDDDIVNRMRYNNKGQIILEIISLSEPNKEALFPDVLKKVKRNGKTVYLNTEEGNPGEYFIILENGDLACYDNQGLIVIMKKI